MELQTLKTIDVFSFDEENGPIKVKYVYSIQSEWVLSRDFLPDTVRAQFNLKISVPVIDGSIQAEKVYQAIETSLGLSSNSSSHFRIFEGYLAPIQGFSPDSAIPGNIKCLSFQKWSFDTKEELKYCSNYEAAMKLVFVQNKAWVDQGWIKTSDEEKSKLEDYSDPGFPLPNLYIKLCQGLEGYNSYHFDKCTAVHTDMKSSSNSSVINQDVPCSVILSLSSVAIVTAKDNHSILWQSVYLWQLNPATSDVCLQYAESTNPGVMKKLIITTLQCRFMVDVIKALITCLQKTNKDCPKFHVSMIKTLDNGSTRWENPLYKETKS